MRLGALLTGAGLGAVAGYLLDPDRGRRRRAILRDKTRSVAAQSGGFVAKAGRDLSNRAIGFAAGARSTMRDEAVSDEKLAARVRTSLGRAVSHPHAVHVEARDGRVTVSGPVLADELDRLLSVVSSTNGVAEVANRLSVHEDATNVPALQGNGHRGQPGTWPPSTRLIAGAAGSVMVVYGLGKRDLPGVITSLIGAGLVFRAAVENTIGEFIDVHKTLHIRAPIGQVYRFWCNFTNFPRFMSHLREVRNSGPGRSHWTAIGPAGLPVSWEAEVTRMDANRCIEWRTLPDSTVRNQGSVRFEELPGGETRLDIHLSYHPPAGALGHAVATFFGRDPKSELDADLVRVKSLLENGKTRAVTGESVTREEVLPAT